MDPNATLKEIESILTSDLDEWCSYLFEWLTNGGFEPDWEQYPAATDFYHRWHAAKNRQKDEQKIQSLFSATKEKE